MKIHIAKEGDSLYSLSQRYSVELDKIVAANPHIADPMRVEPGAKVKVPTGPVTPKVEAMAEKPKVEALAEKPKVEAAAEKPKVEAAAAEKPKVEAAAEKKPMTDFEAETYSPLSQPAAQAPEVILAPAPGPESDIQDVIEEKKPGEKPVMPTVNFAPMPSVSPMAETPAPVNIPSPQAATLSAFEQQAANQMPFGELPLTSLPSAPYLPLNMEHMMPMAETMPMNQMMPLGQMPISNMMPMDQMMPLSQMPMNNMMPLSQMPMNNMMPMTPTMPMSQMMAPIMPMPNENPPHIQEAAAEQQPAAFKTNLKQSAYSPLHVNVPGVEEEAVHPFAQFPAPTAEAGGYMNPFGAFPEVPPAAPFGQPYSPFPPGIGSAGQQGFYPGTAASPYGVLPTAPLLPAAAGMPAYPAAHPGTMMPYPAFGMPLHDCGCGGMRTRPPLPYALPLSDNGTQANVNGFPAESLTAETNADEAPAVEEPKNAKSPKAKKEASVSSRRETVRKFLSTRKAKSKPARRETKPWIYS